MAPAVQKQEQRASYQPPRYKAGASSSTGGRGSVWAQAQGARRSASGRSTAGTVPDDADMLADSAGKGWKARSRPGARATKFHP